MRVHSGEPERDERPDGEPPVVADHEVVPEVPELPDTVHTPLRSARPAPAPVEISTSTNDSAA